MQSGIYEIRNLVNDKVYIGSAKVFKTRWKRHQKDLELNRHHNIRLQRSYNKHGSANFEYNIIKKVEYEKDIIIEQENYYISKFNSKECGYNIVDASFGDTLTNHPDRLLIIEKRSKTSRENNAKLTIEERKIKFGKYGEQNGMFGKTHTDEAKERISNASKGNSYSKGRIMKQSQKDILSYYASKRIGELNPFYGKSHSEETKLKISESNKGKIPVNVKALSIDGQDFISYAEASRFLGIPVVTIRYRCLSENIKFKNYLLKAERLSKPTDTVAGVEYSQVADVLSNNQINHL